MLNQAKSKISISKHGFTLLEVLIVILIIATLTTIAIPMFQGVAIKARFAQMFSDVRSIELQMDSFISEYGWGYVETTNLISLVEVRHGYFTYAIIGDHNPPSDNGHGAYYSIYVMAPNPNSLNVALCDRLVYEDGTRNWWIYDYPPLAHGLGKYLRAVLPKEEIAGDTPWPRF